MTDRETLIALIQHEVVPYFAERIADHLIANGVTIQRWIPVEERLPEEGSFVLGAQYDRIAPEDGYEVEYFLYGSKNVYNGSLWYSWPDNGGEDMVVTHWMPLPEPPKEVE